jgi:MinD-like ATPase involved in chromosome partitioning or flagellar assembly
MIKRTLLSTLVSSALALTATAAQAQISDGVIRLGVMNDMSGLYADITGMGSVIAARMAVEDFGAEKKGMKVEIVSADHQNKARYRLEHRAQVVRHRQGRCGGRRADLVGGAGGQPDHP